VAWLNNGQNLSDIVFWKDANTGYLPSDTTLGQAIWRITDRVGANYNKTEVKYYSYKYPLADRLLIGGRVVSGNYFGEAYSFLIPSATTMYEGFCLWSVYIPSYSDYGKVKLNENYIYDKKANTSVLFEYAKYNHNIQNIPKDTRQTIYIEHRDSILKSAVAILYKTG